PADRVVASTERGVDGAAADADPDRAPSRGPRRMAADDDRSLAERLWRRITRRPREWAQREWTNERIVRFTFTFLSLAICTFIMTRMVHLGLTPSQDLIFDDNTPAGGDFGAQVWAPDALKDHVLPGGWFNGWSMDWYSGLPLYRFYM